MHAEIRRHNGVPTLFIDGEPTFYDLMWGPAPTLTSYSLADCARAYARAGIHAYALDIGVSEGGGLATWQGVNPDGSLDCRFDILESRLRKLIEVDPQARFHLRISLEMPTWWQATFPDECEVSSEGKRFNQSYASTVWQKQARTHMLMLVGYLEEHGLADRVVAYQPNVGVTGEWHKGHIAMGMATGDYCQPMQKYFFDWLRKTYLDNLEALRSAWNDPSLLFETAYVPPAEKQLSSSEFSLRDPRTERAVVDYYHALSDLVADLIIDFCQVLKIACHGNSLVGVFYGYLFELALNGGFFSEREDSPYGTIQRCGHLGLRRVLESEVVEFLASPYSYGYRGVGGEGCSMLPDESVRLHGKLYIFEDDTRSHLSRHDHPNYGSGENLAQTSAHLKRNFTSVLTRGQAIWWAAGWGEQMPHLDPTYEPGFQPLLERFDQLGKLGLQLDRSLCAEIAVLVDDESFYFESILNNLNLSAVFLQRLWGLPKIGAPFDSYLLSDLLEDRLKPYKLYIFLNAIYFDRERRETLKARLQHDGCTALWIYAPGYLSENGSSLDTMSDLTGFHFGRGSHPWGVRAYLTDLTHPITTGLPDDLVWGTEKSLGPLFHLADPEARVLGRVVYSQGRCLPGLGVKEFPGWRSVYSAAPNLPPSLLRGIARYAGVHIYNEASDTLYATRDLLAVHSAAGGKRTFKLPRQVKSVRDLFSGQVIAWESDTFSVSLAPDETVLYYMGD